MAGGKEALKQINEPDELSSRQREILKLAADGKTDKEIAQILCISPWSVRTYWDRLRNRLGASSRTQAVAMALESELDEMSVRFGKLLAALNSLGPNNACVHENRFVYAGSAFAGMLDMPVDDLLKIGPSDEGYRRTIGPMVVSKESAGEFEIYRIGRHVAA